MHRAGRVKEKKIDFFQENNFRKIEVRPEVKHQKFHGHLHASNYEGEL